MNVCTMQSLIESLRRETYILLALDILTTSGTASRSR